MSGQPDFDIYALADKGVSSVAFSADQTVVYASTNDGHVLAFDLATHTQVGSWDVGTKLGALSVSPDGGFLAVTEVGEAKDSIVHRLDLTTGEVTTAMEKGSRFGDLEILDAHTAIISGGQDRIQILNLDTMTYSNLSGGVYYANSSVMAHDGHLTLIAEGTTTDGSLYLYDDRIGQIVAYGGSEQHGGMFNFGTQAISEAAGQVAQQDGRALLIENLDLEVVQTVDMGQYFDGVTYDASGKYAFVYLLEDGVIAKFETDHWNKLESYEVGSLLWNNYGGFGDQLMVDDTDSYITVLSPDGAGKLQLIDVTASNGTYLGTGGADTMAGGLGDDRYTVDNAGDLIVEDRFAGSDTAVASIDYVLAANVDDLVLTGAAVSGVGNALDNRITGDKLANLLDGETGDDRLEGAKGDDQLTGGLGRDTLVGGAGADTLDGGAGVDTASYADAARGVKVDLALAGAQQTKGGGVDVLIGVENLSGSSYADVLKGGAGPNALDGGAGDDVMTGGQNIDRLTGGQGSDTFRYLATGDSHGNQRDLILDLTGADRIDLSAIDADTTTKGDQAFTLVGAFTGHAGEAMLVLGADFREPYITTLSLDVDGDGVADMAVDLAGDQREFTNFVL